MSLSEAVARRRTFAIISRPDAEDDPTEKLLLYGGALHVAGAVKVGRPPSRRVRLDGHGEGEGHPITSSVLQFDYCGMRMNRWIHRVTPTSPRIPIGPSPPWTPR